MSIQLIKNFGKKMSLLLVISISAIAHSNAQLLEETCSMPVLSIDGNSNGLYVEGSYAYVLGDKLKIFDISNPKVPIELGSEGFGDDYPFDLIIKANKAYVLCGDDTAISLKIRIIDVSDPSAPSTVGVTENLNIEWSYYIHNDYLYGVGYDPTRAQRFINVIDISDPTNSETIEKLFFESSGGGELYGSDNILFMTTYIGESHVFNIIDISDPYNIKIIHSSEILKESSFESVPYSSFSKLKKHGQYAYAVTKYSSTWGVTQRGYLVIIDVSAPENPIMKGAVRIPYKTSALHIDYPYAFVGSEYGLDIIDISNPNNPSAIQLNGYVDFNNDTEAYLNGIHAQLPYLQLSFSDKYKILDLAQCFPNNIIIAQWPMSGPAGTRFTQWGTGFTPNTIATLHFQKPDGTEYPTKDISIGQDGHFVEPYDAPLDKPIGDYTWWAVDTTGLKSNEVTYTITERAVPTIAQWPMKGTPGTTFTQWGSGFTPNSTGTLHVQKPDGTEYSPQLLSIKEDGSFEITYKSKIDKTAGAYSWWVVDGVTEEACTPLGYVIEAGETGVLAGFSITQNGGPIADQQIGVPFNIEVRALDGAGDTFSFSDDVSLWSNIGSVKPMEIRFKNGQWNGPVMLNEAGQRVYLSIEAQGKTGDSDYFQVVSPEEFDSYIFGTVRDCQYNLLDDVEVRLINTSTNNFEKKPCKTENGFFRFNDISSGCYRVSANKGTENGEYNLCVSGTKPEPADIVLSAPHGDNLPVLLVPGIMGSTIKSWSRFPLLTKEHMQAEDLMILGHPFFKEPLGWQSLKSDFLNHNIDVYDVPYDWRMDIDKAVDEYLKPAINKAKRETGKEKVNVVAHSMGGLLAREYIQRSEYKKENDIEKLVMVGTPNHGSANAYYLWSGGDAIQVSALYELIIIVNYNFFDERPLDLEFLASKLAACIDGGAYSCLKDFTYIPRIEIKSFIYNHIKSIQRLLPTYLFLEPHDFLECEENKNKWLEDLNNIDLLKARFANPDSVDGVKAKIFAGDDVDTISIISVGKRDCDRNTYKDGKPKLGSEKFKVPRGDGTVLVSSANMIGVVATDSSRKGEHLYLIDVYKDEIFTFITDLPSSKKRIDSREQKDPELVVSIMGKARPYLITPEGNGVGMEPSTKELKREITNSDVIFQSNSSSVKVLNPNDGSYALSLIGNNDESILLNISFQTAEDSKGVFAYVYNHSDTVTIEFTLDSLSEELLIVDSNLEAVDGLIANPIVSDGLKTRLSWDESDNPNVVSYNIYSREKQSPQLTILDSSSKNSFDTTHDWAVTSEIQTRVYCVSAVYENGKESFLSRMVTNDDRDHDNLTDEIENMIGTNLDSPDTDGDGLTDGEEYYYDTNPLLMDTDEDKFNDKNEVDAASDPLDANSFPLKGDINGDNVVNLEDVILSLQILAAHSPEQFTNTANEVSGDLRIGLEEAFYGLREIAND